MGWVRVPEDERKRLWWPRAACFYAKVKNEKIYQLLLS
jgi:hypothetical protein